MVKEVQLLPNVIKNATEIIEAISTNNLKFISRYNEAPFSNFIGMSRFDTLSDDNMPTKLKELILKNVPEDEFDYSFIQIQRYNIGDYILPHKDNYVSKLRLFNLTSSDCDGLCIESGDRFVYVKDNAGQEIVFDSTAWHWVNPVVNIRYSLVIGK